MTTWAIGDLHGCHTELMRLLERIAFDPARDRLWFVGDLVNRGPDSLACLREVRALGASAVCVLGNHDLHLLATASGVRRKPRKDSFDEILAAPDRGELLDWLRRRPLLHHDDALAFTLVHAGVHPAWDLDTARELAGEVERELRREDYERMFAYMYGDEPAQWSPALEGAERLRFAINALTRMRYCRPDGALDLGPTDAPGTQPAGLIPWFEVPDRVAPELRIVFGHWSTLGFAQYGNAWCLDSGCLWGGCLSALCLEAPDRVKRVECPGHLRPGND